MNTFEYLIYILLLSLQLDIIVGFTNRQNDATFLTKLTGNIEDCDCDIEQIDKFNNYHVHPLLEELLKKDYFRYFKVNLYKVCQFWPDDAMCTLKDCAVKTCDESNLPSSYKRLLMMDKEKTDDDCEQSNPLGHLNETIAEENLRVFEDWQRYDDAQDNFCEPDDEYLTKAKYVDLLNNPERYTAYKGAHAHKIWNSIYKENCFKEDLEDSSKNSYVDLHSNIDKCNEKRVFYRLVSGLHTSINVHLCSRFLHKGVLNEDEYWGPNYEEFNRRFDPANTWGQSIEWLKNLYFIYMVELRALVKASSYLEKEITYFTGNKLVDEDTKTMVINFLNKIRSLSCHFDESKMFRGDPAEAKQLKIEFQTKFRNITKIMDCVGCDKCRVWGKMQTQALGTALKILFSGKKSGYGSTIDSESKQTFQLSRYEIVALFNGFGRLSTSISEVDKFRYPAPIVKTTTTTTRRAVEF